MFIDVNIYVSQAPTEPKLLPSKPHLSRGMSFNEETGEKESTYSMWEAPRGEKFKGKLLDRANSFVGATTAYTGAFQGAVVIVDPISTGAHLAAAIARSGAKCVQVLSIWDSPVANFLQEGVATEFCATIQHDDNNPDEDAATNDVSLCHLQSFLLKSVWVNCQSLYMVDHQSIDGVTL